MVENTLSFDFNYVNDGALQWPFTGLAMVTNGYHRNRYFVLLLHIWKSTHFHCRKPLDLPITPFLLLPRQHIGFPWRQISQVFVPIHNGPSWHISSPINGISENLEHFFITIATVTKVTRPYYFSYC